MWSPMWSPMCPLMWLTEPAASAWRCRAAARAPPRSHRRRQQSLTCGDSTPHHAPQQGTQEVDTPASRSAPREMYCHRDRLSLWRRPIVPGITRRAFLEIAASIGATAVWGTPLGALSRIPWRERRDLFPEGVASGDPDSHSVLLWTRRPPSGDRSVAHLDVEVSRDPSFAHVVAHARTPISAASDWTCRVLVGGLAPATIYWYRFTDPDGEGSRVGRTMTAPAVDDPRPMRFVFVSCQNANQGAQTAYRRMIYEDERAPDADRIAFVLHLGDFIYEIVWYPEDRPQGMYDRRLRDVVRYPSGEKISDFHIPTTVDDYRAVYRGYLRDPDLQAARARWPFVNMWDNHEFSMLGWQSLQKFQGQTRPAQTRKVPANQAFFEFQPARMARPNGNSLERFDGPSVRDAPVAKFDDHGL